MIWAETDLKRFPLYVIILTGHRILVQVMVASRLERDIFQNDTMWVLITKILFLLYCRTNIILEGKTMSVQGYLWPAVAWFLIFNFDFLWIIKIPDTYVSLHSSKKSFETHFWEGTNVAICSLLFYVTSLWKLPCIKRAESGPTRPILPPLPRSFPSLKRR